MLFLYCHCLERKWMNDKVVRKWLLLFSDATIKLRQETLAKIMATSITEKNSEITWIIYFDSTVKPLIVSTLDAE